jgi:hypothetical protein
LQRNKSAAKKKGRTMNRMTQSKNSTILPVLTALALSAVTASATPNLPFQLGDEGTITFTSSSTATTTGTGTAIQMGRITSDSNLTIVGEGSCGNEVGFAVEMQDTFTAANGDQLMTEITMQLCPIAPGIYHGVGTYVVTGGTGRFATATGSGVFDGTGNFNTGTIICALNGTISMN